MAVGSGTKIHFLTLCNEIRWSQPSALLVRVRSVPRMTWLEPSPPLNLDVDKQNKILPLFAKLCFFLSPLCAFGLADGPSSLNVPANNIFSLEVLCHQAKGV